MDIKPNKNKIIISLGTGLFIYLFVAFIVRCFPLGCRWWDPEEFLLIARNVLIPVFIIAYLIKSLFEKNKIFIFLKLF